MTARARAYTSREHPIMQPRKTSGYRFALTPLADAMFQLLIFFMLTSSLTPYSLLTVRTGPQAGTAVNDPQAATNEDPVLPGDNAQFWLIEKEEVIVNGQPIPFADLPQLAGILGQNDQAEVILIPQDDAEVQDLTTVLEALVDAGVSSIQLARTDTP